MASTVCSGMDGTSQTLHVVTTRLSYVAQHFLATSTSRSMNHEAAFFSSFLLYMDPPHILRQGGDPTYCQSPSLFRPRLKTRAGKAWEDLCHVPWSWGGHQLGPDGPHKSSKWPTERSGSCQKGIFIRHERVRRSLGSRGSPSPVRKARSSFQCLMRHSSASG